MIYTGDVALMTRFHGVSLVARQLVGGQCSSQRLLRILSVAWFGYINNMIFVCLTEIS